MADLVAERTTNVMLSLQLARKDKPARLSIPSPVYAGWAEASTSILSATRLLLMHARVDMA